MLCVPAQRVLVTRHPFLTWPSLRAPWLGRIGISMVSVMRSDEAPNFHQKKTPQALRDSFFSWCWWLLDPNISKHVPENRCKERHLDLSAVSSCRNLALWWSWWRLSDSFRWHVGPMWYSHILQANPNDSYIMLYACSHYPLLSITLNAWVRGSRFSLEPIHYINNILSIDPIHLQNRNPIPLGCPGAHRPAHRICSPSPSAPLRRPTWPRAAPRAEPPGRRRRSVARWWTRPPGEPMAPLMASVKRWCDPLVMSK